MLYGYGKLEDEIILLLSCKNPNFEGAKKLIRQGADLNAEGSEDDENILTEVLLGYCNSAISNPESRCAVCELDQDCEECEYGNKINYNPSVGQTMCEIIRFFLDHGFDVNKKDGCYGAQCLACLQYTTFDRYIIEATKILLDAGAKNRTLTLDTEDECDTPDAIMGFKASYHASCYHDHALADYFQAVCEIYQAVREGRPFEGVDSFEAALGKKIRKILAEGSTDQPVFYPLELPEFLHSNCFSQRLYFLYDGGVLIITQNADFWTDTYLPDTGLVDVSSYFNGILGSTIKSIAHQDNTIKKGGLCYSGPIVTITMDSGLKVRFSTNFGYATKKKHAAVFDLIPAALV